MAYRRRYYEPFVGTTQTIADEAITPDKLAPSAVDNEAIAPDAVTSSKIKDGDVKADDLGLESVETSKIKNLAVTTAKLAAAAVTAEKLAAEILTRPIAPGVATAEIADLAVTAAKIAALAITAAQIANGTITAIKLGADSVETDKIKDLAVTAAKIATDTITKAQIAANAVEGAEIKNLAVSAAKLSADAVETAKIKDDAVTTPKILDDAVTTPKILDDNVTTPKILDDNITTPKILDNNVTAPKLARDSLRKFLTVTPLIRDDFSGATLSHTWGSSGDAGGSALLTIDHQVAIKTSGVINEKYRLSYNGVKSFAWDKAPKETWLVKLPSVANIKVEIGMYKGAGDYYLFRYDSSVDGNWHAIGRVGAGGEIDQTTGIAATTNPVNLAIDYIADQNVKFYVDDVLRVTQIDPGPSGDYEPYIEVETLIGAIKEVDLDAFIHQESRV